MIFMAHRAYKGFTSIFVVILLGIFPLKAQDKFSFFAIGDMPYNNPQDLERFPQLVQAINNEKPAFTVHVGDIKNGKTPCTDDYYHAIRKVFDQFQGPLIYTPGDNEWTDCHKPDCGGYDPEERLARLRELFFPDGRSMGKNPVKLISQKSTPGFETFVENTRWRKGGITFATLHVVGSNNNLKGEESGNVEFMGREKANLFWLEETFRSARQGRDPALVIFLHGSMFHDNRAAVSGFTNIIGKLKTEVKAFNKPVLVVYGDLHRFLISKPLMDDENNLLSNFTALMVYGSNDMHAVRVDVDVKSAAVFSFREFIHKK